MELYIGGYAQGKTEYVLREKKLSSDDVFDGAAFSWEVCLEKIADAVGEKQIFAHFETWVRHGIAWEKRSGKAAVEELVKEVFAARPDLIVISDEVGNGIVPLEPFEREYRERLGRILCCLARQAKRMERILCGVGQRLK